MKKKKRKNCCSWNFDGCLSVVYLDTGIINLQLIAWPVTRGRYSHSGRSYGLFDKPDETPYAVRHLPRTSLWPTGQDERRGALTILQFTMTFWSTLSWDCPSANINIRNVHRSTALTDLHHSILNTASEVLNEIMAAPVQFFFSLTQILAQ